VHIGDNLRPLGASSVTVDSYSNSTAIPFISKRYVEDNFGGIRLEPLREPNGPEVVYPDAALEYSLAEGGSFWFQVVVALVIYTLAGALVAIDFSKLKPFTWVGLNAAILPRMVPAIVQALSLFWLLKRIGQKIL
jgi:hypothetical protein